METEQLIASCGLTTPEDAAQPRLEDNPPPYSMHRRETDRRRYAWESGVYLTLNLCCLFATAVNWMPGWSVLVLTPPLLNRQFLAFHELMHVAGPRQAGLITRLFPVLETPFSLGYGELRKIHLLHHRYAASPADPEWYQIHGGPARALIGAFFAPEMAFFGWIKHEKSSGRFWVEWTVRNLLLSSVMALSMPVFLMYLAAVRLTIGLSQFVFHHVLHFRNGEFGTFSLTVPRLAHLAGGLFMGFDNLPIVLNHDAHHAWVAVRAEHLPGLLDRYPAQSRTRHGLEYARNGESGGRS